MTGLFMSLIKDAQLKRTVYLLKYLATFQNFVVADQIAGKLNISCKTVLTDIKMLKKKMPEGIDIVLKRGLGVKLELSGQMSVETYLFSLVQDAMEFKILDSIYRGFIYNIHELEKRLFASNFAIRQCIKHINSIIKDYKCRLLTYSVDIEGEEINIRLFFYFFYQGMMDLFINAQERKYESLETYEAFIESTKKLNIPVLHLDFQQVLNWLDVIRARLANKKYIKLNPQLRKSMANRPTYQLFAPAFVNAFFSQLHMEEIPEDEIVGAYVGGLNCIIYNINRAGESVVLSLLEEEDPNVLEKIDSFLSAHLSKFKINSAKNSEAYLIHQAFLINVRLLSQLTPLFQKKTPSLKEYIIEHHQCVYQKWISVLQQTKDQDLFSIRYISDICVTLTMLTVAVMFDQKKKRDCHVLFSFHGEAGYPNYLSAISRSILPDSVRRTYINNQQINDELLQALEVNLLVSNYDYKTEVEDCEIVRFSYIPTTREWTDLKNLVAEKTSGE